CRFMSDSVAVWRVAGAACGSGRKPLQPPASIFVQLVGQAIMQAGRPTLPELDVVRYDPVPAPMRGARRIIAQLFRELLVAVFQILAGDGPALRRHPCTDTRSQRAAVKVCVGLFGRRLLDATFYAHLTFQ